MRIFQDYLQEHGLREEETDAFANCLFLSIARHVAEQENMYSTETPGDPKSLYRDTAKAVRNLALDHMLVHRSAFEGSFGRKVPTLKMTDQTTTSGEINAMMEEDLATEMESETLDNALDPDLDGYCKRMRSETAHGDDLIIRVTTWALRPTSRS